MENFLPYLAYLACPVGMGLMMWMMMGRNTSRATGAAPEPAESLAAGRPAAEPARTAVPAGAQVAASPGARAIRMVGGICLNWRVVTGLAAVGLAVFVVAPGLIGLALPVLILAACPLSMLLMTRGRHDQQSAVQPADTPQPRLSELSREEQLATRQARLVSTQDQQDAISREIAEIEAPPIAAAAREGGVAADNAPEPARGSR